MIETKFIKYECLDIRSHVLGAIVARDGVTGARDRQVPDLFRVLLLQHKTVRNVYKTVGDAYKTVWDACKTVSNAMASLARVIARSLIFFAFFSCKIRQSETRRTQSETGIRQSETRIKQSVTPWRHLRG